MEQQQVSSAAVASVNRTNINKNIKMYRCSPLKDFVFDIGSFHDLSFGANSITGWRLAQEDRYVCLPAPRFKKNLSFFGIYDGHGGEEVAEYLKRKLHVHILEQLEDYTDIKMALDEGFKACDQSLRALNEDEFKEIKDSTAKEFSLSDYKPSTSNSAASISEEMLTEMKNELFKCIRELQTGLNKVSAPPSGKRRKGKSGEGAIKGSKDDENEVTSTTDSTDNSEIQNAESSSPLFSVETENEKTSLPSTSLEKCIERKSSKHAVKESKNNENEAAAGSSSSNNSDTMNAGPSSSLVNVVADDEAAPLIGLACGSTATVVILNDFIVYTANVGDSRCIASINGAVRVLSHDHRPLQKREKMRILASGHTISRGRIDGGLNMSRAFGDFGLKDVRNLKQTQQAVSVQPYIGAIEIDDVDFIVIASDGIWNNMDNEEVLSFVSSHIHQPLPEICAQIFEHILAGTSTSNGGQDNMSMIIIKNDSKYKKMKETVPVKVETETTESMRNATKKAVSKKAGIKTGAKKAKRFKK